MSFGDMHPYLAFTVIMVATVGYLYFMLKLLEFAGEVFNAIFKD